MALRNLVDAQCGEGNALVRLTHHVIRDKAMTDEGLGWHHQHPVTQGNAFKTQYGPTIDGDQLVEDFMTETQAAAAAAPQAFRMDSLLQEMREIESRRARAGPMRGPGIADLASEAGTWAEEYLASETHVQEIGPGSDWTKEFVEHQNGLTSPDIITDNDTRWAHEYLNDNFLDDASNAEASKWIEEYNPQEDSELAKTANELLGTVDDPKFSNSEFMKFIKKLGEGSKSEGSKDWSGEFLSTNVSSDNTLSESWSTEFTQGQQLQLHEQWQKEFNETKGNANNMNIDSESMSEKDREKFWQILQDEWEEMAKEDTLHEHPWLSEFNSSTLEPFKEYKFEEDNPLKEHPNPLKEGKQCLEAGDLPSAVLLFEAAAQQDPQSIEAWLLLGMTHAENEQDPAAIAALRKCVDIDSKNSAAWMALATSYTNESYQTLACNSLKEWMRSNPEYNHLVPKEEGAMRKPKVMASTLAPRELIQEVQDLYIASANQRPSQNIDPDVQCGLGVLFNLTGEYEKAVDCFQSALSIRPKDAKLWNKLGATLANSERSEEAIEAYRNALEAAPGFIRCRYNLGISCINLGAHREAMEHFLEALNMQAAGRGPSGERSSRAVSDNIWSTLRVCLSSLNAIHLLEAVEKRDLTRLNEEFSQGKST